MTGHRARIASNPLTRKIPEELRSPLCHSTLPGVACGRQLPGLVTHPSSSFAACLSLGGSKDAASERLANAPKANVTASQSHHTSCLLPSCHISGNEPQPWARLAECKAPALSRSSGVSETLSWRELSYFPLSPSWRKGHTDTKRSG